MTAEDLHGGAAEVRGAEQGEALRRVREGPHRDAVRQAEAAAGGAEASQLPHGVPCRLSGLFSRQCHLLI